MKLLDKIKDLFMDEVIDDDEVLLEEEEQDEYKEPPKEVLPKVMRDTIKKEEKEKNKEKEKEVKKEESRELKFRTHDFDIDNKKEPENAENVNKFIDFGAEFMMDESPKEKGVTKKADPELPRNSNINVLNLELEATKKVSQLYPDKKEVNEKPKFKATPVISPVYGILDKNYTKEEVKEKTDDVTTMKRPSKKVDFETVRKKAFGNLADEIKDSMLCENCELYKEVKKISSLGEDDLLYDMTIDEEEKDVTIEKAYDNYEEFGVAYEPRVQRKRQVYKEEADEEPESYDDKVSLDDIINDTNNMEEDVSYTKMESKVDNQFENMIDEVINDDNDDNKEEEPIGKHQENEKGPVKEENKKETKVDADFFELIDSMYKERVDE